MSFLNNMRGAISGAFLAVFLSTVAHVDLSRFDAAPLIAFTATKKMNYVIETDRRISARCGAYALTSGLTRKQVADDLGVGMSTLNKWITAHRDTDVVSKEDLGLAQENDRLRR